MNTNMRDAFKKAGVRTSSFSTRNSEDVKLGQGYTERAEKVILELRNLLGNSYQQFTTSKIRNILSMVSDIYNEVVNDPSEVLSVNTQERIEYLKVRLVYECGREAKVVKPFVEKAGLLT